MLFPWLTEHTHGHHALGLDIGSESIKLLGINANQYPAKIENIPINSVLLTITRK